jgi:hypothetical protein
MHREEPAPAPCFARVRVLGSKLGKWTKAYRIAETRHRGPISHSGRRSAGRRAQPDKPAQEVDTGYSAFSASISRLRRRPTLTGAYSFGP